MRNIAAATTILLIVILPGPVFAQTWKVKLDDVYNEDPNLDRTRAEAVEFLPDGKTLITAGWYYLAVDKRSDSEVQFWSVKDGSLNTRLMGGARVYSLRANSLACSSDGKQIAAAGTMQTGGRAVDVFDVATRRHTHTLKGRPSFITGLRFSPKKNVLAVAHADGIDFWNPATGEKSGTFIQNGGIGGIAFSADGSLLAVAIPDGSVSFRNPETGDELGQTTIERPDVSFDTIVVSPDGRYLAVGGFPEPGAGSPIYLWELRKQAKTNKITARLKAKLRGHEQFTYSLAFSPDSKLLASASQDHTVRLWDVPKAEHLKQITEHTDFVYDVAFSPDGKHLATLGRDSLMLWPLAELRNAK